MEDAEKALQLSQNMKICKRTARVHFCKKREKPANATGVWGSYSCRCYLLSNKILDQVKLILIDSKTYNLTVSLFKVMENIDTTVCFYCSLF